MCVNKCTKVTLQIKWIQIFENFGASVREQMCVNKCTKVTLQIKWVQIFEKFGANVREQIHKSHVIDKMTSRATLRIRVEKWNASMFGTKTNKPQRNTNLYRLVIQTSQCVASVVACYVMRTNELSSRANLLMTSLK